MSIVQLTPEVREVPYFSSFSKDEEQVTIPRLFVNESMNYSNLEELMLDELLTMIENRAYLGLTNEDQVKELLWRLGETKELWSKINDLNVLIQHEIKPYLNIENYEYVYGVRCKINLDEVPSLSIMAEFGNIRLLDWARSKGREWTGFVSASAARNGQLKCLQYLIENGCPWTWASFEAARCNQTECFNYLKDKGCPWAAIRI